MLEVPGRAFQKGEFEKIKRQNRDFQEMCLWVVGGWAIVGQNKEMKLLPKTEGENPKPKPPNPKQIHPNPNPNAPEIYNKR